MFNKQLNGFAREQIVPANETITVLKELTEIYERLKHMPGKHNQEDHAWNAGLESKKKRSSSKPSKRVDRKSTGISSPFEATRYAANQARNLGVKNTVALTKAITSGTNALRMWSDKFRAAVSTGDQELKKQVVSGFKELSTYLTQLSESLAGDAVSQNIFRAIIQSYQETIAGLSPESAKVFSDYPLYESDTPDAKIANTVGNEISKNAEKK